MKQVEYNGKHYRVQANGLVHVLENNSARIDWKVLNRKVRAIEYIRVIKLAEEAIC
jgi:hypothetical protein